jgi:hypothetical protein
LNTCGRNTRKVVAEIMQFNVRDVISFGFEFAMIYFLSAMNQHQDGKELA